MSTEDPIVPQPGAEAFTDLLAQARAGDREALEELVRRYYPRVEAQVHERLARDVRIGRPWVRARFSTGDVVQEVFRSVIGDLDQFYGSTEDGFSGWLAVLVRNRIVDSVRFHEAGCRDGRLGSALPEDDDPSTAGRAGDPAQAAATLEEFHQLEGAMQELGQRLQHLLRARLEGLASFRELAEQLGYGSESAARRAFFEAQARLVLRLRAPPSAGGEER